MVKPAGAERPPMWNALERQPSWPLINPSPSNVKINENHSPRIVESLKEWHKSLQPCNAAENKASSLGTRFASLVNRVHRPTAIAFLAVPVLILVELQFAPGKYSFNWVSNNILNGGALDWLPNSDYVIDLAQSALIRPMQSSYKSMGNLLSVAWSDPIRADLSKKFPNFFNATAVSDDSHMFEQLNKLHLEFNQQRSQLESYADAFSMTNTLSAQIHNQLQTDGITPSFSPLQLQANANFLLEETSQLLEASKSYALQHHADIITHNDLKLKIQQIENKLKSTENELNNYKTVFSKTSVLTKQLSDKDSLAIVPFSEEEPHSLIPHLASHLTLQSHNHQSCLITQAALTGQNQLLKDSIQKAENWMATCFNQSAEDRKLTGETLQKILAGTKEEREKLEAKQKLNEQRMQDEMNKNRQALQDVCSTTTTALTQSCKQETQRLSDLLKQKESSLTETNKRLEEIRKALEERKIVLTEFIHRLGACQGFFSCDPGGRVDLASYTP